MTESIQPADAFCMLEEDGPGIHPRPYQRYGRGALPLLIENKERDEDSKETDDLAVIYGSDYDEIGDQIREVLKHWSK